MIKNYV